MPKDVSFGADVELILIRSGDVLTLYPATTSLTEMAARLSALPRPSPIERRDEEEIPERSGL